MRHTREVYSTESFDKSVETGLRPVDFRISE